MAKIVESFSRSISFESGLSITIKPVELTVELGTGDVGATISASEIPELVAFLQGKASKEKPKVTRQRSSRADIEAKAAELLEKIGKQEVFETNSLVKTALAYLVKAGKIGKMPSAPTKYTLI